MRFHKIEQKNSIANIACDLLTTHHFKHYQEQSEKRVDVEMIVILSIFAVVMIIGLII